MPHAKGNAMHTSAPFTKRLSDAIYESDVVAAERLLARRNNSNCVSVFSLNCGLALVAKIIHELRHCDDGSNDDLCDKLSCIAGMISSSLQNR
jgi:hypothetical protein